VEEEGIGKNEVGDIVDKVKGNELGGFHEQYFLNRPLWLRYCSGSE